MKFFNNLIIFFLNFKIINSYQNNKYSYIIKQKLKSKYCDHNILGYKKSRDILFNDLKKTLVYGNNISENINCEHIWCQKYFNYKEPMKSDLHIMFLANSKLNSHRQDYKFSNIYSNFIFLNNKGNKIENNFINNIISFKLYKKNNSKKLFEPNNKSKGKISRSVAYYDLIYNNHNKNINNIIVKKDLIEWNRKHLPRIEDIERNEMIRTYQKNINPFIKYPFFIELLYNDEFCFFNFYKLSFYSIFTIIISDLFKIKFFLKKNIS